MNESQADKNEISHKETKQVIQNGFGFILNEEEKSAILVNDYDNEKNPIIPRSFKYETEEFIVTSIADRAFEYSYQELYQFPLNSEIKSIGEYAFFASRIKSILIPSSVVRICKYALGNCHHLKKVDFAADSKLQIIEKGVFDNSSVEHLSIPSSVVELKDGWCNCLTELTDIEIIQNKIQNISMHIEKFIVGKTDQKSDNFDVLLYSFRDIEEVIIPSFIRQIGSYAFSQCKKLKTVEFGINSKIESIEKKAFFESSLKKIKIPSSIVDLKEGWCECTQKLTDIEIIQSEIQNISIFDEKFIVGKTDQKSDTFDVLLFSVRDIVHVTIPSHIKRIDSYAFNMCKNIDHFEFQPNSQLQIIGRGAFNGSSVTEITIPSSVIEIGKAAFCSCENLVKVEFEENSKLKIIGKKSFSEVAIESIAIPPSVIKIESNAFEFCYGLQKVEFSVDSKIQTIEKVAFYDSSISKLTIPSSIVHLEESWCSETAKLADITIFENEIQNISFFDNKFIIGKTDPKSDIYDILLFSRRDVECVTIPPFIRHIAPYAFNLCKQIKSIEFAPNSNLIKIAKFAFECASFSSIKIPKKVTSVGERAFYKCDHLRHVEFDQDSELKIIEEAAFNEVPIEKVVIPSHVTKICKDAFLRCKKLAFVDFDKNSEIQSIDDSAFSETSIRSFLIPKGCKEIDKNAFKRCKKLQMIELEENSCCFSNVKQTKFSPDANIMVPYRNIKFFNKK